MEFILNPPLIFGFPATLIIFSVIIFVLLIFLMTVLSKKKGIEEALLSDRDTLNKLGIDLTELKIEYKSIEDELSKYKPIQDIEKEAEAIKSRADEVAKSASLKLYTAEENLKSARITAEKIVSDAKIKAEEIAGDAYKAMTQADELSKTAKAMKNIIKGYGDEYIIPTYSLLDDLADEFGFTEAGKKLKEARDTSRRMIKDKVAATCEYAEITRRETAMSFVVDAFNGKVDSILSRTKSDNYGKLEAELKDAFSLVNYNGAAFRNARITDEYLAIRLEELKWGVTAKALKDQEREEQRVLREQIREEEKARREYEKAIKDAAKEEDTLRKAMEKIQQQAAAANEAQRAEFEEKLAEMEQKLKEAEEKNQRALSMAQQTKTGHVYVISNIGSFGEDVFKIGMTRRLDPQERVTELGDASVPFAFDVHAMIYSEDAPTLEKSLHKHFMQQQVNKVNPRKEFFKLKLDDIRQELNDLGIETHWTLTAQATEYRETLRIEQQMLEQPESLADWTQHQLTEEAEIEEQEAAVVAPGSSLFQSFAR